MSQTLLFDHRGEPLVADGPQFGPERHAYGPVRFEHQPAWVRSRGRKQKAGNKRAKGMLQRLADAGRATVDDLAALAGFSSKKPRRSKKRKSSGSTSARSSRRRRRSSARTYGRKAARRSRRASRAVGSSRSARRSARRYQARLRSKMSGFSALLGRSSLGKKSASRLRRRLARCGDYKRLGRRSKISRKHARALRRELRRCQGAKIAASSRYAGLTRRARRSAGKAARRASRRGASRRLARSGSSGGMSYAKLMKRLRGTKMKAWVCVGPKRTGCGGGRKGKRGARVWGILRP